MLWVHDDYLGVKHHMAENFKFDCVGLSRSRLGKNHHVGIFHLIAVKNDQRVIVLIDAVHDAGFHGQF